MQNINSIQPNTTFLPNKSKKSASARVENDKNTEKLAAQQTVNYEIDDKAYKKYQQFAQQQKQSTQVLSKDEVQQQTQAERDQPSKQNLTAVNSYFQVESLAKRETIQQVFGVDLFA
jgi:thymidylate kinase